MQIDCRNMECPKPVIETKNALEKMQIGESLSILVNDTAPLNNVKKFLSNFGMNPSIKNFERYDEICVIKTKDITEINDNEYNCEMPSKRSKLVYFKDDKIGPMPIGETVLTTFLSSLLSSPVKPKYIICVNNSVLMTTNRDHYGYKPLKDLENAGVKIISCGSCLKSLNLVDKLSIGELGNAYEIAVLLMENDVVSL
ncbi:sulfurtransferase-like selenium metabolism protein YedF [Campylobacter sp. RM12327]|uniref:sulfurtransferase-like selenium metabolism protein YedF n=1 Tax=Campylobacter sputorum TaxID=206 RepID=UPI00053BFF5E|nr:MULTISPECIES: sulfurtransferase-like selenium metabolism protein YedF [Campylobacter]ASM39353.1 selenium metabolism protein [Campylobacter sputorum]MBE7358795.1 sulfurtransferase-like selenium metabolism protein YedF [Campylobacter sp. RM11302]MBF6670103.1 sulfurtransferase-like selenium metabolism protein YedF [Campylobacter sp. RM12327]MBF6675212.1 sulfurtransferase-like selenium metabolism protein YedF [Campylobacter sp. RM13538]MBF6676823.1 sulfurtransferase-like selenium metabolism pro